MIRRTFFSTLLAPILARFAPEAKAAAPVFTAVGWADGEWPGWEQCSVSIQQSAHAANLRFHRDCFAMLYPPLGTQEPTMRFDPPIVPSGDRGGNVRNIWIGDPMLLPNGDFTTAGNTVRGDSQERVWIPPAFLPDGTTITSLSREEASAAVDAFKRDTYCPAPSGEVVVRLSRADGLQIFHNGVLVPIPLVEQK